MVNLIPLKLCNGVRLQVSALHANVIEAIIFTDCGTGETVFLPKIPLIPSDYYFQLKRLQLQNIATTVLRMAGVDLTNDCISHPITTAYTSGVG